MVNIREFQSWLMRFQMSFWMSFWIIIQTNFQKTSQNEIWGFHPKWIFKSVSTDFLQSYKPEHALESWHLPSNDTAADKVAMLRVQAHEDQSHLDRVFVCKVGSDGILMAEQGYCHDLQHTSELAGLIPTALDPMTSHKRRRITTNAQSGNREWDVNTGVHTSVHQPI